MVFTKNYAIYLALLLFMFIVVADGFPGR